MAPNAKLVRSMWTWTPNPILEQSKWEPLFKLFFDGLPSCLTFWDPLKIYIIFYNNLVNGAMMKAKSQMKHQ
jgi:hypothetical protein